MSDLRTIIIVSIIAGLALILFLIWMLKSKRYREVEDVETEREKRYKAHMERQYGNASRHLDRPDHEPVQREVKEVRAGDREPSDEDGEEPPVRKTQKPVKRGRRDVYEAPPPTIKVRVPSARLEEDEKPVEKAEEEPEDEGAQDYRYCTECSGVLRFVEGYGQWYCDRCRNYVQ